MRRLHWRCLAWLAMLFSALPAAGHWLAYDAELVCRGTAGVPQWRWCTRVPQGLAAAPVPVPGSGRAWLLGRDGSLASLELAQGRLSPALAQPRSVTALAASSDGRILLASHGTALSLLDAQGALQQRWPVRDRLRRSGEVLALADLPARRSFVVALKGLAELWEISYDPAAAPLFEGLVHDYRMGEGLARPGYLGVRRTPLAAGLEAMEADGRLPWLLARQHGATAVLHLDVRRRIALLPAWADATAVTHDGGRWTLVRSDGSALAWFDTQRWQPMRRQAVGAPVRGLRAASQGGTLWVLTGGADGAAGMARWPALAEAPAATWGEAGAQVGPWWVDEDGRTLTLLLQGAGVLALDGHSLRPLQRWTWARPDGPVGLVRLPG